MDDLWDCLKDDKCIYTDSNQKAGLRFHFEKGVIPCVREICIEFSKWLREEYSFPIRVNVYIKKAERIKAMDGELVCGTCWRPNCKQETPYIKIATGDYYKLCKRRGQEKAIAEILLSIAHELSHYFQWLNDIVLTPIGEERQASRYADLVVSDFYHDRGGFL